MLIFYPDKSHQCVVTDLKWQEISGDIAASCWSRVNKGCRKQSKGVDLNVSRVRLISLIWLAVDRTVRCKAGARWCVVIKCTGMIVNLQTRWSPSSLFSMEIHALISYLCGLNIKHICVLKNSKADVWLSVYVSFHKTQTQHFKKDFKMRFIVFDNPYSIMIYKSMNMTKLASCWNNYNISLNQCSFISNSETVPEMMKLQK